MSDIVVDTYKLKYYAERLANINNRISKLDRRLDGLYLRVGLQGLWDLLMADILTGYSVRLSLCQSYLTETADDFEKVEKQLFFQNQLVFNPPIMYNNYVATTYPSHTLNSIFNQVTSIINDQLKQDNDMWEKLKNIVQDLPEDFKNAGDTLKWAEELVENFPNWITLGFDIVLPDSLQDAYTLTSGLLQGNLTVEECWDTAKNILSKNDRLAIVCETIDYALEKGDERSKEMNRQMYEQLKEGDILGAVFDGAEGFVDTIIGGSIEVLADAAGSKVDNIAVVKNINKVVKYGTGILGWNDGEGYSIGGLIGSAGESVGDGIDKFTDMVTDTTDIVTDAITDGVKSGINWVKSFFG